MIAQKAGQADPPAAAVLTPEQITATLVQLVEGKHQTQQHIEALLAQWNNPHQAISQLRDTERGQELSRTYQRTQAHPSHAEDAREVINNRRATREEGHDRTT